MDLIGHAKIIALSQLDVRELTRPLPLSEGLARKTIEGCARSIHHERVHLLITMPADALGFLHAFATSLFVHERLYLLTLNASIYKCHLRN